MVNFGPLAAEIGPVVLGTPANFNGFCVLAALLYGSQVVGVSQTLRVEQRAPPMFGRATITLGIGPHSSLVFTVHMLEICHNLLSLGTRLTSSDPNSSVSTAIFCLSFTVNPHFLLIVQISVLFSFASCSIFISQVFLPRMRHLLICDLHAFHFFIYFIFALIWASTRKTLSILLILAIPVESHLIQHVT